VIYDTATKKIFSDPRFSDLIYFIGTYLILITFFYADSVRSTFMVVVTYSSAAMIEALGLLAEASAATLAEGFTEIKLRGTIYRVHEKCTGLPLILLVAAAVGAVPARAKLRLIGVVTMIAIASVVACLRIVLLGLVAEYNLDLFDIFHSYIMKAITVGFGISLLMLWSKLIHRPT